MKGRAKRRKNTHKCMCIYLKMDCKCLKHTWKKIGNWEGEKDTEKRSFLSDQRGCFMQGNCTVLLLWERECKLAAWLCDLS